MTLLNLIKDQYKIVSVVGMAKNAGKTVALRSLMDQAQGQGIPLGLTSTGRDGESLDIVTMTEKPVLDVPPGTLISTAADALARSQTRLEILEVTDLNTPMGKIVIGKTINQGLVELAGPETNRQIRLVAQKMLAYGAALVVVDGAIDRKAAAAPAITEATILATGAVLSRDINRVIAETAHQVELFTLKSPQDLLLKDQMRNIMASGAYGVIHNDGRFEEIPITTALRGGRIIGATLTDSSRYVILRGSLVKSTLEDISQTSYYFQQVIFVVQDATKIFIEPRDWKHFNKKGFTIQVLDEINLVAVTTNPYAPQGYYLDPRELRDKMKRTLAPLPVFDLYLEEE